MRHPRKHLRDWWKVPRVLAYLALRPQDIPRYCRFGGFGSASPIELGMPWWSFGAVDYLESKLGPDSEVFEFGCGGSSLFVGARVRSLTCVEDDQVWATRVSEAALKSQTGALSILCRPFDFSHAESFDRSDYLLALSGKAYDAIIIDGKELAQPVRHTCFRRAEEHIKPGGVIVLDDSWRYPEVKARNRALRWREFTGVGYCRYGVTSTSVFEY